MPYDPQTQPELQTSQPCLTEHNKRDRLIVNTDGSVDFCFGPKRCDKTWRPGEIELMK